MNQIIKKIFLLFVSALLLCGCAGIRELVGLDSRRSYVGELEVYHSRDYLNHLSVLGEFYLQSEAVEQVNLSNRGVSYLEDVYNKIVSNNELIIASNVDPSFYLIKSKTPFFFSLPGSQFFFSTGLVDKYLKNEDILVSMLGHEIVKSIRGVYEKRVVVPVGFLETQRMLQVTRIPLSTKMEVNKWAYFAIERAGYDPSAFLSWLQVQNKNTLDFSMQLGDTRTISREEFLFKNFIVSNDGQVDMSLTPSNSSQEFYYFLRNVREKM